MKYIDANKLYKKIDELMARFAELEKETETDDMSLSLPTYYQGKRKMCSEILTLIDSLQQEQPDDLASLISEATNVAKRIVDWDSFYNSLPQNLRNKYTSNAWREILEALSTMKEQEQPSMSSNLDEAAEEYADYNSQRWHEDGDVYYDHSKIMDAFKAGAEWMAEQGAKKEE